MVISASILSIFSPKFLSVHQDNARVHTCTVLMAKIVELILNLLKHSLDFAPSDFFLSPNLTKWFDRQRFTSNEEAIAQTDAYFEDLPKS